MKKNDEKRSVNMNEKQTITETPASGAENTDAGERNWPVKELVDRRCNGASFDDLAEQFGTSKMKIYVYYQDAKNRNFDGYEPYKVETIKRWQKDGNYTVPEMAKRLGLAEKGLRFYMMDRGIKRQPNKVKVRNLVKEGKSLMWIARFYGMTYRTLSKWLKENTPEVYDNPKFDRSEDS